MRITAAVISVLLLLAVAGKEMMWRFEHPLVQAAVSSPAGAKRAEVRSMPEGSVAPYGFGVFVSSPWVVLRSLQANLAYAGYCRQIAATWQDDKTLRILCAQPEEVPKYVAPKIHELSVEVSSRDEPTPNPSFKRTGLRPAA